MLAPLIVSHAVHAAEPAQSSSPTGMTSMYDLIVSGGPVMWPIGLCSVVALAYAVERAIRMRRSVIARRGFDDELLAAVRAGGPARGIELCGKEPTPLARVLAAPLARWGAPLPEVEKSAEDAGAREVHALTQSLRPFVVVAVIAPLLGLLGTVWGMILSFNVIATHEGLGSPEMLASGVAQALVTTAAGLVVAIPTQVLYYWFKARIDRFVKRAENLYSAVVDSLRAGGVRADP